MQPATTSFFEFGLATAGASTLTFAKTFLDMEAKLKDDEVQALKAVLGRLVIRSRTGEVGIMHGMERFVSTQLCMKKQQLDALHSAAKTLGLSIPTTDK